MAERHPFREYPSSSDLAEDDDDRLCDLLHAHLSYPSRGDVGALLHDHPENDSARP